MKPMGEELLNFWRWLLNATQQAAIAENPAVMTAAGWRINRNGLVKLDLQNNKNVKQLRNNLTAIGDAAISAPTMTGDIDALATAVRHPVLTIKAVKKGISNKTDYVRNINKTRKELDKGITKANASKITPEQWTAAQDAAIAKGDVAEAQRLRDLHFKVKSPNNKAVDSNGMPLPSYHAVKDKYSPDFMTFNPEIEGTHSSIYTTDNPFMSGSYTTKITSEAERDHIIEVTRQRELNKARESLRNAQSRKAANAYEESRRRENIEFAKKRVEIYSNLKKAREQILSDHPWAGGPTENERMKRVYVNLENPLILDNSGGGWNNIPLHQLPTDVYDLIKPDIRGNLLNASYTTRSLEEAQRAVGRYDGSIIKDIVDYGGQKQYGYVVPGTDFQINNPSSIKLANAVTHDDKGVRIPLGERDNFKLNDIRYGLLPFAAGGVGYGLYNTYNR